MDEKPKRTWRRYFRFGLRSLLLVLTVVAVVLGYHANWIRQRREASEGWLTSYWSPPPNRIPKAPGLLWLLGERGYGHIWRESTGSLTPEEEAQLAKMKRLFPEATITWEVDLND